MESLWQMITGKVSAKEISGPVGIIHTVGDVVDQSRKDGLKYVWLNIFSMGILLTANLGVVNLFPIPALDGGRLVFLFIEAVRGKPIKKEREAVIHLIGMVVLMVLMVLILFNDIGKLL